MKIGRNEICPKCNSGKKYKKCCGDPRLKDEISNNHLDQSDRDIYRKKIEAEEYIKKQQQGIGKPIVQANAHGKQFVKVGDTVYRCP